MGVFQEDQAEGSITIRDPRNDSDLVEFQVWTHSVENAFSHSQVPSL